MQTVLVTEWSISGWVAIYFEELLARIRDIRSSEKVFWQKVLDIYATSIDYDGDTEASQLFFKTVQSKMHWAAHGHTAAEITAPRADGSKPAMGLTHWTGSGPKWADIRVSKNYWNPDELDALNRIVVAYLEFAELQALNRKPMHMRDWISKLDDFLKLGEPESSPMPDGSPMMRLWRRLNRNSGDTRPRNGKIRIPWNGISGRLSNM